MSSQEGKIRSVHVQSENVGGIDRSTVDLHPGVTVLAGRNATNRTSFLQSLMAALGSENVSLKGDADEGSVVLGMGDERYTRTLKRSGGGVMTGGDPYLDDAELADLFAFLLESNEARRTVATNGDLRELIMRPIDTDAIRRAIEELEAEKRELDEKLEELDSLERELPDLQERRTELEDELEGKRAELADKETEIEEFDADVDETREEKQELDGKLEELRATRSDLEDVRFDVETQRKSIEASRDEQAELEAELESLDETPTESTDDIDAEVDRLRERVREIDATVSELQTIVQFNEEMLEGTSSEVARAFRGDDGNAGGSVTDTLLDDSETVVCWTCGTNVEKGEIETTLDRLKEARSEKFEERSALEDELEELKEEKRRYEEQRRERERIEDRLAEIEAELEERAAALEDREAEREELNEAVETLEGEVEALEAEEYSEILDLHREANQLEFELGRLQDRLGETEDEIDAVERRIDEREELRERREEVRDELTERRTRIERIEETAVEEFNEQMATVLDILEYGNIARIWIERTEREVREGRRKVSKSVFDLHVVRSTDGGTTYEDTIDHLSESEREVTGLVFALAGYLVHEVYEQCPFMLLDSLEAIDSERIATLVDHFEEYVDFLVVALLPEDARALDAGYERVSDI